MQFTWEQKFQNCSISKENFTVASQMKTFYDRTEAL